MFSNVMFFNGTSKFYTILGHAYKFDDKNPVIPNTPNSLTPSYNGAAATMFTL